MPAQAVLAGPGASGPGASATFFMQSRIRAAGKHALIVQDNTHTEY